MTKFEFFGVSAFLGVIALILALIFCIQTVPAGHVSVGDLFGEVQDVALTEGWHAVNPLWSWTEYDCRQQTYFMDSIQVAAEDQLSVTMDLTVQWHIDASLATHLKQKAGTLDMAKDVLLVPISRSTLREVGKSMKTVMDFSTQVNQQSIQDDMHGALMVYCAPFGVVIDDVLMRGLTPPPHLATAITAKAKREQLSLEQEMELTRFAVEAQQVVKKAEADKTAALIEAETVQILADARAYEIAALTKAIAENPAYIELEALKRWNGTLPVTMAGGAVPFINVGTNTGKK